MMVYRPKYLKRKRNTAVTEGVLYKRNDQGGYSLLVNGQEMSAGTKKAVITLEVGAVPIVEIVKQSFGNIHIDEHVQVVEKSPQGMTDVVPSTFQQSEIKVSIGGREIGKIAASEIQKYHEKVGHAQLNL